MGKYEKVSSYLTPAKATMWLLEAYRKNQGKNDNLDNLYEIVKNKIKIDQETFLKIVSNELKTNDEIENIIYESCYEAIGKDGHSSLGNYEVNGRNQSAWISHCLISGEFAKDLANAASIDTDTAQILGILHDIGRAINHPNHVLEGYNYLVNKLHECSIEDSGLPFICITHSYLNNNMNAQFDNPPEGSRVGEDGRILFDDDIFKNQKVILLEQCECELFDNIIQMADLFVLTRRKITIEERIYDIMSRRSKELKSLPNFPVTLIELHNVILNYLHTININVSIKPIKYINKKYSELEINYIFESIYYLSDILSKYYDENIKMSENVKKY